MNTETFAEEIVRRLPERLVMPEGCSHCGFETTKLTNYSKDWGGNVGGHWLCRYCEVTISASALGAGGRAQPVVRDVAVMLNVLDTRLQEALSNGESSGDV